MPNRRGIVSLLIVALLLAVLWLWLPARAALQAAALLPDIFPNAPLDPLADLAAEPSRTELSFPYGGAGGTVQAVLFQPSDGGRHAALVLALGAGPLERADLGERFAGGLARLGIVTLDAESSGLLAERITPDEVDAYRASLNTLDGLPDVDAGRIGFLSLSAAGGLALLSAEAPDLRERVHTVATLGAYSDAQQLLIDVASQSMLVNGQQIPWQPEARTREVVQIALINSLPDARDRALLQAAPPDPPPGLTPDGQTVFQLLQPLSRARAEALVQALPPESQASLRAISPVDDAASLQAHLFLLHDRDDTFIPFTQSHEMAAAAPPAAIKRFTEFSIFAHVIPDRPVPWQTFLPDLWALFWDVQGMLLDVQSA